MSVSYFLNAAVAAELIDYEPRKAPRKLLDYVPPSWTEPMMIDEKLEAKQNQETSRNKRRQ
jgi:hypothetical protein